MFPISRSVARLTLLALGIVLVSGMVADRLGVGRSAPPAEPAGAVADDGGAEPTPAEPTPAEPTPAEPTPAEPVRKAREPGPPADTLELVELRTISGDISPKSVVASGSGVVTAQNMMYKHTVTAYDAEGRLLASIPDTVRLTDFGIDLPGEYQGAPVEAAFTGDGSKVFVSNYSMFGPGFREGKDSCTPASEVPASYLYGIDTGSWTIEQVIPVGAVPKYVAVTPDDERVLTTNWCSWDLTVSDADSGAELATVPLGRYPRGIAVAPDGGTAYVAMMGETRIARVSLEDYSVGWIEGVGAGPRHLSLSPDGAFLFVTLNKEGTVAKVDIATGEVVARQATGSQPRSMDISTDGTALYVVNYDSGTMSKLDSDDLTPLQEVPTGSKPIGITYDDSTGRVWVANYSGTIDVYDEVPA